MSADDDLIAQLALPDGVTLREPTGLPSWPLVLIEGKEKTGKTWQLAQLSADPRLGPSFYIGIGEVAADEYGAIPGARFKILDHDGSYRAIRAAVEAVCKLPVDVARPPVLTLDSASNLWTMLSNEADQSARKSKYARTKLADDPEAEIPISPDKWNTAKKKWRGIMDPLLAWPGLVIITARGDEQIAMDENGRPAVDNRNRPIRTYKVEAHKSLPFDVGVIVRTLAPGKALVKAARSVSLTVPEDGIEVDDFSLSDLLFGEKGLNLGRNMSARTYQAEKLTTGEDYLPERTAKGILMDACLGDVEKAKAAWAAAKIEVTSDGMVAKHQLDALVDQLAAERRAAGVDAQQAQQQLEESDARAQAPSDAPADAPAASTAAPKSAPAPQGEPDQPAPQGETSGTQTETNPEETKLAGFLEAVAQASTIERCGELQRAISRLPNRVRQRASTALRAHTAKLQESQPAQAEQGDVDWSSTHQGDPLTTPLDGPEQQGQVIEGQARPAA